MLKKVVCFFTISMALFSLNAQASIETLGSKDLTKELKDKIEKFFAHNEHSEEEEKKVEEETLANSQAELPEEVVKDSEEEVFTA